MTLKALLKAVKDAGWPIEQTKKGHHLIRPPSGPLILVSGTPSDWRGLKNARAQLRRAGVNV